MNEISEDSWVKIFESPVIMEAELLETRLKDENIEFMTLNKSDLGYTVEIGQYWTYNAGKPVEIYVHPKDEIAVKELLAEDRSAIFDDPGLDYGELDDQ